MLAAGIATLILLLLRRLLRRPPPRSELYSLPNGKQIHHLRKAETDFLYKEIFRDGGYLQELTGEQELRLTLAPGDVVVDVGANIGLFAMYCAWAPEVKGDVTVLAYECVPTTHAVLQRNAALATASCPKTTVLAHGYGLSDARSSSTVHHHPNFSIWSTVRCRSNPLPARPTASTVHAPAQPHQWPTFPSSPWQVDLSMDGARDDMLRENLSHACELARERLPAALRRFVPGWLVYWAGTRLLRNLNRTEAVECEFHRLSDAVFRERGVETISLLKIDVEGAELSVLRGIDEEHWPRIQQIAMELESEAHAREASALLRAAGFEVRAWVNPELVELLPTCEVHQLVAKRPERSNQQHGTRASPSASLKAKPRASKPSPRARGGNRPATSPAKRR